jgi:hypothetical protein
VCEKSDGNAKLALTPRSPRLRVKWNELWSTAHWNSRDLLQNLLPQDYESEQRPRTFPWVERFAPSSRVASDLFQRMLAIDTED